METACIDIENATEFVKINEKIEVNKNKPSNLPTFIKLNLLDKSEVTKYRFCLYGAMKVKDPNERKQKLSEFERLVRKVYSKNPDELKNLEEYLQINHECSDATNTQKHHEILRFYTKKSFYHSLTNNLLRISRTID